MAKLMHRIERDVRSALLLLGFLFSLQLTAVGEPSTQSQIAINNVAWGTSIGAESKRFAEMGLELSDTREGKQCWKNAQVTVWLDSDGKVMLVRGDSLHLNDRLVIEKGQKASELPENFASLFHKFVSDKRGLYGIASFKDGTRYLLICDLNKDFLGTFFAEPLPPPGSIIEDDYPYNFFNVRQY